MEKITKVWFDEERGVRETTMRLTREELAERFGVDIKSHAPATPEIWYGANQVGKAMVMADIQRAIDSLKRDGPTHEQRYLSASLYDKAEAAGYPLDGVMRLAPHYAALPQRNYELLQEVQDREAWNRRKPRPPAAAKSRAALHPLVGRLIDNLNKEN